MSKLSRKESVALAAVIAVFGCVLGWTLIRMTQSSAAPGVTLHEAFAQPPGGIPPGPPPVISANTPPATSTSTSAGTFGTPAPVTPSLPASQGTSNTSEAGTASAPAPVAGVTPAVVPSPAEVVVHVAGAVHSPGVYHLPLGARNDDAIKKAGGPTANANTDGINLAARIEDGSQLFLPTRQQHPEGGADAPTNAPGMASSLSPSSSSSSVASATGPKSSGRSGAKGVTKAASAKGGGKSGKLNDPMQGKVNINTASVEELQRLPGIGPAMAERISEFRKQGGKFTAPEDLLQISGIGRRSSPVCSRSSRCAKIRIRRFSRWSNYGYPAQWNDYFSLHRH